MTLYSTKRNTFILKCFIQCTCTNLDGSQKEGGNFFNLLQKEGVPRKGGFPQKRGGSYPGGNYALSWRRSLSYRNQSIDLLYKSMEWFLYDRDLRHETVKLENNFFVKSLWIIKNRLYRHSHIFFCSLSKIANFTSTYSAPKK